MPEVLAIVPARAGSKGLPNKNILDLAGHPLLAYSVVAGLRENRISRVICSTDSSEIAEIAKKYGAEAPFLRPFEFAKDNSRDIDAFSHALNWLQKEEQYIPDLVVNLRPTSPIRFEHEIDQALEIMINSQNIDSLRSIAEPYTTPYKMWITDKSKVIKPLLKLENVYEPFNSARQDLPQVWAQTGALEIIKEKTITKKCSMSGDRIYGFKINTDGYIDIDSKRSLEFAQYLIPILDCIKP